MELQIGLAIVDQMTGGKETTQRMQGWMARELRTVRRLRLVGARALVALAARLEPALRVPERQAGATATAA